MSTIKILVCCHKKTELPNNPIYLPIQVGKSRTDLDLGIQTDNEINGRKCDNISQYNNIYCEMTAVYWAWKNVKKLYPDIQYIGLCHYRRYFSANISKKHFDCCRIKTYIKENIKRILGKRQTWVYIPKTNIASISDLDYAVSAKDLESIIKSTDVTLTTPVKTYNGNVRDFFSGIGAEHILLLEKVVKEFFSDYYSALEKVLNGRTLAPANMIIMKYKYYDSYCSFVFGVLSKHIEKTIEKKTILNPYEDSRYSRISGYLAELLTYTYVVKYSDRLKIQMVDSIFVENP